MMKVISKELTKAIRSCPVNFFVVIPTNISWKNNFECVLGAGLALITKKAHPEVPYKLGKFYHENAFFDLITGYEFNKPYLFIYKHLIFLPSKGLNNYQPHLSWQAHSDLNVIEQSLNELRQYCLNNPDYVVCLPPMGVGNGQLDFEDVFPLINDIVGDLDNIVFNVYRTEYEKDYSEITKRVSEKHEKIPI